MEFYKRLIELRKEKDLSQSKLADKLNVSASIIGMYEQNRRMPSYEKLEEIADFFNVDMDYLMGRTNIKNKFVIEENDPIEEVDISMLNNLQKQKLDMILQSNMAMFFNGSKDIDKEEEKLIRNSIIEVFIHHLKSIGEL